MTELGNVHGPVYPDCVVESCEPGSQRFAHLDRRQPVSSHDPTMDSGDARFVGDEFDTVAEIPKVGPLIHP